MNRTVPLRREWAFRLYVLGTVAAAVVVLTRALADVGRHDLPASFWMVAGLVLLGELRPLLISRAAGSDGVVLSTTFVFAALLQWGLGAAVALQLAGVLLADVLRRRALRRTVLTCARYTLSWGAAQLVLDLVHSPLGTGTVPRLDGGDLPAVALAAVAYFVVNTLLVSVALAAETRTTVRERFFADFGYEVLITGGLLASAPLVVLAAEHSWALVPLVLVPLAAVYQNARAGAVHRHRALHDTLTGLPNRKLLFDRAAAITASHAGTGRGAALLLLDLDRFKEVNDTLGHHTGDRVLEEVARRIAGAVRPADTVARLGGDEFAVLLPDLEDEPAAVAVARRVVASLDRPFAVAGPTGERVVLDLGASVGIAHYPRHATDVAGLLQRADVAMYVAKDSGARWSVYSADADRNTTARLMLVGEVRAALRGDPVAAGFAVHYEPQVDLASGAVVRVEALARWCHPVRGDVPTDDFVGAAERGGVIRELAGWKLDTALRQLREWTDAGIDLAVSANISVRALHTRDFAGLVADRLAHHRIEAGRLQLELSEARLLGDPEGVLPTLRALEELGVGVSLDDFGGGYAAVSPLRPLPVSEVKIGRSYIAALGDDPESRRVVRMLVTLAHAVGHRVVAEGVDTAAVWRYLGEIGCDEAQGELFGAARPAAELTAWLASGPRFPLRDGAANV
ncbi:MAG: cph1 [Mycobacterium sp.]|nr:cph1 [Mycobacterium sp.]